MQPQETVVSDEVLPQEMTAASEKQTKLEVHSKRVPRQRHFLILFFFSFMWGTFGVDRMYMGLIGTGILKLLTLGGFGLWTLTDLIIVMTGTFKDKQGRVTLQFNEYKKFAERTILWFAVIIGLIVLVNGIILILGIFQLTALLQDGNIPGLEQLQGGAGFDQTLIDNSLIVE